MATTINGHTLTLAERTTLDIVLAYMHRYAGDSWWKSGTSPKGDGRAVPVTEIFSARNNQANAQRRTVSRLASLGVLQACEMSVVGGCIKGESTWPTK